MLPLISIVIINYNRESYLGEAIASILKQTWENLELLVWDDGSTDKSVEIARKYVEEDSRVKVIAAPHQGIAKSRQQAISQTKGVYLGYVDSDDFLAPTALAETATILNREPEIGFVYTDYIDIDKDGNFLNYGLRCHIPYSPERLLIDFMTFQFRLIRRSVYQKINLLGSFPDYADDYDICLRLSGITQVKRVQKPLYYYRQHSQNTSLVHRKETLLSSQKAIHKALKRRGMSDKYQIDLDLSTHQLILRRKKFWQDLVNSAIQTIKAVNWRLTSHIIPLIGVASTGITNAQIVPATDGTGTIITSNSNTINIHGGTTSGLNLFHSFQEFGISQGQIANFQAHPNLQNILSRINGGNPSIINGLIQVTGGSPNLYLMNPSGFVFGNNAALDIPRSLTVTTANGIGLGNSWFNAFGTNDYSALVGNPSSFAFTMNQQGSIINAGNLTVLTGESLNLLGGTVANTGNLGAPGGQISITSVPGENWVRLSQPGNLLSLEIQPFSRQNRPISPNLSIASLPELLTIGNTGLTAYTDGTVKVGGSDVGLPSNPGTTIVSKNVNVSGTMGGNVNILGDQVALINANVNASGNNGGGNVLVGGSLQGKGTAPNATNTYIDANSVISVDSSIQGDGGTAIIWADNSTKFFGNVTARGGANGGNGGFVEVSGKNYLTFNGQVDTTAPNGNTGNLLLDPATLTIIDIPDSQIVRGSYDASFSGTLAAGNPDIGANTISWRALSSFSSGANIELQATGDITINDITGNTTGVTTPQGVATLNLRNGGSFRLTSQNGSVNFVNKSNTIRTTGGAINISGTSLNLGNLDTYPFSISNVTSFGHVTLTANGNIFAGDIVARGGGYVNQGGNIQVISENGNIQLGNLDTRLITDLGSSTVKSGNVTLSANGTIDVGNIDTSIRNLNPGNGGGEAGSVKLETTRTFGGNIRFSSINAQGLTDNTRGTIKGGNVELLTNGLIQGTGTVKSIINSSDTIGTGAFAIFSLSIDPSPLPNAGGTIKISHDGGQNNNPFSIGDGVVNGTAYSLNRGDVSLAAGSFPVLPNNGDASGTPIGITITSVNTPPTITPNLPTLFNTEPNQSVPFIFNAVVADTNSDNTTVVIDSILAGILRRGSTILAAGDTITLGETLIYTPPTDGKGIINAFSVRASDRISFSTPSTVTVNFNSLQTPPPCIGSNCSVTPPPINIPVDSVIKNTFVSENVAEGNFTDTFTRHLGISSIGIENTKDASNIAREIAAITGVKPAFIYLSFVPAEFLPVSSTDREQSSSRLTKSNLLKTIKEQDTDELEIILVTGTGNPIRKRIPEVTKGQVLKTIQEFRTQIVAPQFRNSNTYLKPAQKLHSWIIKPIEADLQGQQIKNLVFLADVGLRSTPIAALHDGKEFLIEKYSIGLMPSLTLTDTNYTDIKKSQILAIGVSESTQGQAPLPAVPLELTTLINRLWSGKLLLNKQATVDNIQSLRRQQPFGVIHLATHADFIGGAVENSYIQLWENKLRLNQIRQLGFNNPQVEMLVLSACRSALGNEEAEIGFAGLAVLAGVKTSVASLWAVGDTGTAALMTKFYESLQTSPIRAEALRQAQLAMAKGRVYLQDGRLQGVQRVGSLSLPSQVVSQPNESLAHPYYWAAFTMVGNPW